MQPTHFQYTTKTDPRKDKIGMMKRDDPRKEKPISSILLLCEPWREKDIIWSVLAALLNTNT